MRWFKHMTHSANDEKLSRLRDAFGLEGYGFWWSVVEIIAEKVDENEESSVTFSAKKWGNLLGISAKKFRILAEFCANLGLIFTKNVENGLTVSIPNILKYRDEYSERQAKKSGQCRDKVRPSRARVPDPETETETDPPNPPRGEGCALAPLGPVQPLAGNSATAPEPAGSSAGSSGLADTGAGPPGPDSWPDIEFCQVLDAYPAHQRDEAPAWQAWLRLSRSRQLPGLPRLLAGLTAWESSAQWRKDDGKFIPRLSNWLSQQRWAETPAPARDSPGVLASEEELRAIIAANRLPGEK